MRRPALTSKLLFALMIAALVPLGAPAASAQPAAGDGSTTSGGIPVQLRPGTRRFFAGFHLGGAANLSNQVGQFKIAQEFGWNILGAFAGPAVGLVLQESFGSNFTTFQLAPKFWWKFQILRALGLYVSPFIQLGFMHQSFSVTSIFGSSASASNTAFNWQFGVQGHLMIIDRIYVMLQPFAIDLVHDSGGTGVRYDFLLGGGATF